MRIPAYADQLILEKGASYVAVYCCSTRQWARVGSNAYTILVVICGFIYRTCLFERFTLSPAVLAVFCCPSIVIERISLSFLPPSCTRLRLGLPSLSPSVAPAVGSSMPTPTDARVAMIDVLDRDGASTRTCTRMHPAYTQVLNTRPTSSLPASSDDHPHLSAVLQPSLVALPRCSCDP